MKLLFQVKPQLFYLFIFVTYVCLHIYSKQFPIPDHRYPILATMGDVTTDDPTVKPKTSEPTKETTIGLWSSPS